MIAVDACTTIDPGSHEAARLMFRRVWGLAIPTREILNWLSRQRELIGQTAP